MMNRYLKKIRHSTGISEYEKYRIVLKQEMAIKQKIINRLKEGTSGSL